MAVYRYQNINVQWFRVYNRWKIIYYWKWENTSWSYFEKCAYGS
jgi:hypothetical protein